MAAWFQEAVENSKFEIIPRRAEDSDGPQITIAEIEKFIDELASESVRANELDERGVSREVWWFKMRLRQNYREGPCVTKMQFQDLIDIVIKRMSKPAYLRAYRDATCE